jgi:hypothetical protein
MAIDLCLPSPSKRLSLERRAFLDLLRLANTMAGPEEIAQQMVVLARHISGCEAVAIRLKRGPGYPFATSLGFSTRFLALEDELCAQDEDGHLLRGENRQPILACLCGKVLSGEVDRKHPWFTDRGSFVTPSTSLMMDSPSAQAVLGRTRNRCHLAGYETVGLFPIRRDGVTYGLILCNDHRPGRLSAEVVDLMENFAAAGGHLFQLAMA